MRRRSLLVQVLAVNLLLVAGTVLVATIAVDVHLTNLDQSRELFPLGLAIVATLLGNWQLLRRPFQPLDAAFQRMISRLEVERRGGRTRGDPGAGARTPADRAGSPR